MDETAASGVRFLQRRAHAHGADKFGAKPVRVDGDGLAGLQDAHTDRRRGIIQTDRQEAALVVKDDSQVAGRAAVTLLGDGLIEDPGMSLPQGALCGRADPQRNSFRRGNGELGEGWGEVHCVEDYTGCHPVGWVVPQVFARPWN